VPSGISSTAPESKAKLIAAKQIALVRVSLALWRSVVTSRCPRPLPSANSIPVTCWIHGAVLKSFLNAALNSAPESESPPQPLAAIAIALRLQQQWPFVTPPHASSVGFGARPSHVDCARVNGRGLRTVSRNARCANRGSLPF
jgi:hypothetical protein